MVLCPDVAPCMDRRFDCRDLLQRSVIRYAAERKASSAIISTPIQDVSVRLGVINGWYAVSPSAQCGGPFLTRAACDAHIEQERADINAYHQGAANPH